MSETEHRNPTYYLDLGLKSPHGINKNRIKFLFGLQKFGNFQPAFVYDRLKIYNRIQGSVIRANKNIKETTKITENRVFGAVVALF